MSGPLPRRLRLLAALCTGIALMAASSAQAEPALTTYPLPSGVTAGGGIATDPAGVVWFATADQSGTPPRIARFDLAQVGGADGGVTTYPTPTFPGAPCCATAVRSIAYDATRGKLWFVRNDGLYGYAVPGQLTPGSNAQGFVVDHLATPIALGDVSVDPTVDGVWMTESSASNVQTPPGSGYYPGNRVARVIRNADPITPGLDLFEAKNLAQQNGELNLSSQESSLRFDAKPAGIASDGQGGAWFAEADPGNPGWRLGHVQGTGYTEYGLPCVTPSPCSGSFTGTGPTAVAIAKDGAVWFSNELNHSIGRFDGGTFTTYPLASISGSLSSGRPGRIAVAADGTLWVVVYGGVYSNQGANAIVRIVPTSTPTATVYPTGSDAPFAVTPSATGDVWFTLGVASGPAKLGRLVGAVTPPPPAGGAGGDPAASPAPAPAATPAPGATKITGTVGRPSAGRPVLSGDTATVDQQCVGPPSDPCALVFIISAQEYVRGFPGTRPRAGRLAAAPAPKTPVVLGQLAVTLNGGEKRKIKIRLSKKARKALAIQGSIKTKLTVSQTLADGTSKVISTKKLTFKRKP